MKDQCAQQGPRGGRCRNRQKFALDFCAKHHQMILDGKPLFCLKCNGIVDRNRQGIFRAAAARFQTG